jgi:hypothetical protein
MKKTKIKIKKVKIRDFNIKKMMENPKKSGPHIDRKKQTNKDNDFDADLEEYIYKRLRDPYFTE